MRRDERCISFVIFILSISLLSSWASAQCDDCDDNNPCTKDLCEAATCQHIPQSCDDAHYAAGVSLGSGANSTPKSGEIPVQKPQVPSASNESANCCVHDPVNCDDGNASTADQCGSSGCINTPFTGESSKTDLAQSPSPIESEIKNESAEENTTSDESQSVTEEEPLPICDDGNDSTLDFCMDGSCINKPFDMVSIPGENNSANLSSSQTPLAAHHPPSCDDHDLCTEDTFNGKECEHKPKNCDDGDPNTFDYCFEGVCYHTTTSCDDGDNCTIDSFNGSACVHTPRKCDDGNPCTVDYCDSVRGCMHRPVVCAPGRTCIDGVCRYLYYPYVALYYPCYQPYVAPVASTNPAAQSYTIPAGTAITLPWAGSVTALNTLKVENAVAYPGASPLKFVRSLGLEDQVVSGYQTNPSISERSVMIGLSWKDASFILTLIQPNGNALPVQGDNRNVIHLIGPYYDYYFLRNAAQGNWGIEIRPINPGANGAGFSLISGLVKGAAIVNQL